jgi:alpha-ribazole phosphatase
VTSTLPLTTLPLTTLPLTTVTLVRHLAVSSNVAGRCYGQRLDPGLADDAAPPMPGLTPLARMATRRTSPAARAQATAALIDGAAWTVDAAWAERDFGDWEGRPWEDCWEDVPPSAFAGPEAYLGFDPPGAEPYGKVVRRVTAALGLLPSGQHLTVTHLGPIRAALHAVCGWSAERVFATTIGHGGGVVLDRGQDDGWTARVGLTGSDDRNEQDEPARAPRSPTGLR